VAYLCFCIKCCSSFTRLRKRGSFVICSPCQKKQYLTCWYRDNPGRRQELRDQWVKNNPDKNREIKARWQKDNPENTNSKASRYRARKLKATPSWATQQEIQDAYMVAQIYTEISGIPHHVDHIVPLQGKNVCGLHWHENLQVIPGKENQMKSNKLEGNA